MLLMIFSEIKYYYHILIPIDNYINKLWKEYKRVHSYFYCKDCFNHI